jgi:hypothetical protein
MSLLTGGTDIELTPPMSMPSREGIERQSPRLWE